MISITTKELEIENNLKNNSKKIKNLWKKFIKFGIKQILPY